MNRVLIVGIFFTLLCLLNSKVVHCQTAIRGIYVGYQQNPFCYYNKCKIEHPENYELEKNKLYYKVTLNFTDSLIYITKLPVKFIDDDFKLAIIDSTAGGYYSYTAPNKYEGFIHGYLINCNYCYKSAHGIPLYTHSSYRFIRRSNDLILSSDYEKNILFRKLE